MEKIKNITVWLSKHSQALTILLFIIFYFRWLFITPLEFESYNDPNESIIFGIFLLVFYTFSSLLFHKINTYGLRFAIGVLTGILFFWNLVFLLYFFPRTVTEAHCKNTYYIISTSSPLSDPQWVYFQFTKWTAFKYETFFFGYSGYNYKIICDEKQNEANVIIPALDALDYTDGISPRWYTHSSAIIKDALFILSEDWHIPEGCDLNNSWECDTFIYTLYKCKTDYTSCHALPIRYYDNNERFSYLEADLEKNEINLFNSEDDTRILTYGENPRCYVEGCEILNP